MTVSFLYEKPGGRPHGWTGLPVQAGGYPTGNGQRAALPQAGPISSARLPCLHKRPFDGREISSFPCFQQILNPFFVRNLGPAFSKYHSQLLKVQHEIYVLNVKNYTFILASTERNAYNWKRVNNPVKSCQSIFGKVNAP